MTKVTVIGAGSWGCALAMHLSRHHDDICLWDIDTPLLEEMKIKRENTRYLPGNPLPEKLSIETDFNTAVRDRDLILVVVPSHVFSRVIENLKPHLSETTYLAWATKGIDPSTLTLLSERVEAILGQRAMAMLSGPSFAKEVAEASLTVVDVCCNHEALTTLMKALFNQGDFRLQENHNFTSVQLGGTMKNVVAIAVGMADGLGLGTNATSAIMTAGLQDEMHLAKAMGVESPASLISYSAVGDLILTCSDNKSRNRRFGRLLGQGKDQKAALDEINQTVEGLDNCPLIIELAEKYGVKLSVASGLLSVLENKIDAKTAIKSMLAFT